MEVRIKSLSRFRLYLDYFSKFHPDSRGYLRTPEYTKGFSGDRRTPDQRGSAAFTGYLSYPTTLSSDTACHMYISNPANLGLTKA